MGQLLFTGSATALVTPFMPSGEIDETALRRLIRRQLHAGIKTIILLGTTGEPCTISMNERERILAIGREEMHPDCKLIAGTGSNDTRKAIEYAKQAKEMGADGQLIVTPYYNKATQTGLRIHYEAILDACNLPAILYHVPGRTGMSISMDTLVSLQSHPMIAGVKDAGGSIVFTSEMIEKTDGLLSVYCGNDELILPMMTLGCRGAISVCSNLIPTRIKELVDACLAGRFDDARTIHYRLAPLFRALFAQVNPIPVKAGLEMLGLIHNQLRLPLTQLHEPEKEQLLSLMKQMDLLAE